MVGVINPEYVSDHSLELVRNSIERWLIFL
jgi:hypothetical protein